MNSHRKRPYHGVDLAPWTQSYGWQSSHAYVISTSTRTYTHAQMDAFTHTIGLYNGLTLSLWAFPYADKDLSQVRIVRLGFLLSRACIQKVEFLACIYYVWKGIARMQQCVYIMHIMHVYTSTSYVGILCSQSTMTVCWKFVCIDEGILCVCVEGILSSLMKVSCAYVLKVSCAYVCRRLMVRWVSLQIVGDSSSFWANAVLTRYWLRMCMCIHVCVHARPWWCMHVKTWLVCGCVYVAHGWCMHVHTWIVDM